jgi:hypothetical protein
MPYVGMNTSLGSPTGPGSWVAEAIAEQEEYIKRSGSCKGVIGLPHDWDRFAAEPGVYYSACTRCRVTKTRDDYATKIGTG